MRLKREPLGAALRPDATERAAPTLHRDATTVA
jgi:hypothetical protein